MSKLNSYQRLRAKKDAEIKSLKQDIRDLLSEDYLLVAAVKMRYQTINDLSKMVWAGSISNNESKYAGLFNQIKTNENTEESK